jgi:2-methylcitrate dehydratase
MTLIEQLAAWVLAVRYEQLSETAIRHAKLLLLDSIGCALAALEENEFRAAVTAAEKLGGTPECTIIGSQAKTSAPNAALANGALLRALDLNDIYWGPNRGGHPSDDIATVLAAAERSSATGREVIAAIALGYEINGRLRDITVAEGNFDYTTLSVLVASATSGRLLGLNEDQLANALALGATFAPSLGVVRGGQISAAKWLGTGLASHTGLLAALLAAEGLSGPRGVMEDPHGWSDVVQPGAELSRLAAPAKSDFRIEHASVKAYPCVMTGQTSVAAALRLRQQLGGGDIERIEVRLPDVPMMRSHVSNPQRRRPASRETADHSIQFLIAVAWLDGQLTPRQFHDERWLDPVVLALMDRLHIDVDPALNRHPDTFACWMRAVLRSGQAAEVEVRYPPGHHLGGGMNEADVGAKFDVYARPRLRARAGTVKELALNLEAATTIRPLMDLLGG